MRDRIRAYVSEKMKKAPSGVKVQEFIDEITEELFDRYTEIVRDGYSEEEAYQAVIEELGSLKSIIRSLKSDRMLDNANIQRQRKISALLVSIGVGCYTLAAVVFLIQYGIIKMQLIPSLIPMICLLGLGTCLLIYNSIAGPKYARTADTLVEDFKEFRSFNMQKQRIRKSVTAMVWSLTVAVYFVLSVMFNAWGYTWIVFLIGGAVSRVLNLAFDMKE